MTARAGERVRLPAAATERLTGEAAHFVRCFDTAAAAAFLVDGRGRWVWANAAFAALTGVPVGAHVGANGAYGGPGAEALRPAPHPAPEIPAPRVERPDPGQADPYAAGGLADRVAEAARSGDPVRIERVRFDQESGPPRWATGSAVAVPTDDGPLAAAILHEIGLDVAGDLARLLAGTPVLILTTDPELRCTWVAGGVSAWPAEPRSLIGRALPEVLGVTDPEHPWVAPFHRALGGEQVHQRATFGQVHLDYRVGPLLDGERRTVGTVAVAVDVTDTELARYRQQVAEERFQRLVEHSPAVIDVRDAADRVVHANPAFLRTFGVRLADVVGHRPAAQDLPGAAGSDVADLLEAGRRVRETGQPRAWQGRVPHPEGHLVELLGHVFPLPAEDGRGTIGEVFVDVTAHERSRRELGESEQRFRAFFNGAEIGVLVLDLDARVVDANPAALRLTGRTLQAVRGQPVDLAITAADAQRHAPLWGELVAGRRGRYDLSVTLRSSDGRLRPARLTVTLVRTAGGAPSLGLALAVPLATEAETVTVPSRSVPSAGEAAVLERLAAGAGLQQIATELGMSRRGVDYRITRLRHKLRADGPGGTPTNSAALIARAYTLGILHPAVWPPRVVDAGSAADRPD
jgi:PAS domain S-box-containing protein